MNKQHIRDFSPLSRAHTISMNANIFNYKQYVFALFECGIIWMEYSRIVFFSLSPFLYREMCAYRLLAVTNKPHIAQHASHEWMGLFIRAHEIKFTDCVCSNCMPLLAFTRSCDAYNAQPFFPVYLFDICGFHNRMSKLKMPQFTTSAKLGYICYLYTSLVHMKRNNKSGPNGRFQNVMTSIQIHTRLKDSKVSGLFKPSSSQVGSESFPDSGAKNLLRDYS